ALGEERVETHGGPGHGGGGRLHGDEPLERGELLLQGGELGGARGPGDADARPGVREEVAELHHAALGVDEDDDAAGVPGGQVGDDEGGTVLQEEGHALTGFQSSALEGAGEGGGVAGELSGGEALLLEVQDGPGGGLPGAGEEGLEEGGRHS